METMIMGHIEFGVSTHQRQPSKALKVSGIPSRTKWLLRHVSGSSLHFVTQLRCVALPKQIGVWLRERLCPDDEIACEKNLEEDGHLIAAAAVPAFPMCSTFKAQ